MNEISTGDVLVAVGTAIANAGISYGIVKTHVAWLRRDVDELRRWKTFVMERWDINQTGQFRLTDLNLGQRSTDRRR